MEIFYAADIQGNTVFLDQEESVHCVRVLRHKAGDEITVVDGAGTMMRCSLTVDSPKGAVAEIVERFPEWGAHPYKLTMAVCPTKNNDRFEWFVEKVTELGVDEIVPVIGERSERRVLKPERSRKIALSAMKQSLKARLPLIEEPTSVKDFILTTVEGDSPYPRPFSRIGLRSDREREELGTVEGDSSYPRPFSRIGSRSDREREELVASTAVSEIKLICYCFEGETERKSIEDVLTGVPEGASITIMIGPEGDFSPEEARQAVESGFIPVHLGPSRLRTETAAVTAATAVYLHYLK